MKRKPLEKNLILIGFMGTGKSTVSEVLSRIYQMPLMELDQLVEAAENRSITEIFRTDGEAYFREIETRILHEVLQKEGIILSCGGGTPIRQQNVEEMKKSGIVILLTAEPETVWERIKDSNHRPILAGNMNIEYLESLMKSRREVYLAAADVVIVTDGKRIEEVCEEIIKTLEENA